MENLDEEIQSIINRLTDDDGCAYPNTPQITRACEDLHKLKAKVKNLAKPDVSGRLPNAEDVKRWYQLLVGKSEIDMQKDIEATLR